jgi:hypothetical protein
MKVFSDRMARWVAIAFLIHGGLVLAVGIGLFENSLYFLKHPGGEPHWRIFAACGGSALAIVVGAGIVVLSFARLLKPFEWFVANEMLHNFETLFVAEAVVILFGGGLILDGGVIMRGMMFLSLMLNLLLLGIYGGRSSLEVKRKRNE